VPGWLRPTELKLTDQRIVPEEMFVRPSMLPRDYIELTDAIAAAISGPKIDVQLGPAGVQWCSRPLLEAIAENSALTGRRIHMHLLETIYQRAYADEHFPGGVVNYLRDIGLLTNRLTLAHCIHARPDELEIIAASGAHCHQLQFQPASALRPRADRRRAPMRLRHRGRRRWAGARRR